MTRRILSSYLLITVLVLLVLEVPLGLFFADREVDQLLLDLERDASVLASFYEDVFDTGAAIDPSFADNYASDTGARVLLVDIRGTSILDTERAVPRNYSTRPEVQLALTGARATGSRYSETLATELRYVAVPVTSGGEVFGAVRLTLDSSEVNGRIRDFWFSLAAIGLVILAMSAAIGWVVARSIGRPIRELQNTVSRFASGNLEVGEMPERAPHEIEELASDMNHMAHQLGASLDSQRAFVADASHQLRTPVTALLLRLEAINATTDDSQTDNIDAAIHETKRLGTIVDELLGLARASAPKTRELIELSPLVADRVDTWTAVAEEHSVRLVADITPTAPAHVPPGSLEQILDNLIDNAVTHGGDSGVVEVSCTGVTGDADIGDTVRITVRDHGPGLNDEDKAAALGRFWRHSSSGAGSGLGLAIVDALVKESGGRLELHDTPGGGLTVVVVL